MLKLLLITLSGDPDRCLEEIPSLEIAITEAANVVLDKPLYEAHPGEIKTALDKRNLIVQETGGEQPERNIYRRAIDSSRHKIAVWLAVVGRFGRLRRLFQRQLVLSFVGVHNAGKSSLVNGLFGLNSHADLIDRTEQVQLFHLGGDAGGCDEGEVIFDVADFPGATDERPHIANITQRMSDITTLFVCTFSMGHVAEPERRIVDMVRSKNKEFIVFINKIDAYADEFKTREADLRESYASALNVDTSQIVFVSTKWEDRIEYVRKLLFATLSLYVGDELAPQLAVSMLHPKQTKALEDLWKVHNKDKLQFAVTRALLDTDAAVTYDSVLRHLHDARPTNAIFVPTLVETGNSSRAIGRRISMSINLGPTRAAYDFTVDLLSRLGYQPHIIMVTLKIMRVLFGHNRVVRNRILVIPKFLTITL